MGNNKHQTQWAAQFAVASELCKRRYEVALTMGNHPVIDLMVRSPKGRDFVIDVKGQVTKGFWSITPKQKIDDLFYVLALVSPKEADRFFVLSQSEVETERAQFLAKSRRDRRRKGLSTEKVGLWPGLPFKVAERYEVKTSQQRWGTLPA